jgi:DNA polymerase-1
MDFRDEFDNEIATCEAELAALKSVKQFAIRNGEAYSPTNTNHLAKILKQAGHKLAKTEKGGDATDVKNITKFKDPVVPLTIRHRKASKVVSVYIDAVTPGSPHLYDDGKVHPIISTTTVDTWRTSSEDPNVQNWPKRNANAKIRKVVGGKRGWKVVSFDYAGIQARNVAMESRDRRLIKAFLEDYDIHSDWLEKMHKICPDWVPLNAHKDKVIWKAARNGIKNQFVFPSFFGARPSEKMCAGIAPFGRIMPKPSHMAELQEWFFDDFPDIADWHAQLHKDYDRLGYVTGCSGHRRYAPVSHTQIINSPIQADESIIVLSSHIALSELDYTKYQPMMEIHDDLTFWWPEKEIDARAEVVIREMCKVRYDWIDPIPLEIEMSIGDDWASQKEVGKFRSTDDGGWREIK